MFGPKMRVEWNGFGVSLVPFKKEWMDGVADKMSSIEVNRYTLSNRGYSTQDEEEWFDRMRTNQSDISWAILPDGEDFPVGTTGLHSIDEFGKAATGIIIWNRSWWGRGVASRTHLMRTWYAADVKNRLVIHSSCFVPNIGSRRALQKVGYFITGKQLRYGYADGKYMDMYILTWLNPERIHMLYPDGKCRIGKGFHKALKRAQETLDKARELVQLL